MDDTLPSAIQHRKRPIAGHCILLTAIFLLTWLTQPLYAEQSSPRFSAPYLGGNIGISNVENISGYGSSESLNAFAGFYLFQNLSAELWIAYLGEFDVKNLNNAYSKSSGLGASLAYRFDMGQLFALRPSVGIFYSDTEIYFEDQKIGDDSGSDYMLGLSGVFTANEHVLVNLNVHLFKDVSGADIVTFSAGAGYQF